MSAGTSMRTTPDAGARPQATVRRNAPAWPPSRRTVVGDRCTATGTLPAGAGPLPCIQYRAYTGCAGSTLSATAPRGGAASAGIATIVVSPARGTVTAATDSTMGTGSLGPSSHRPVAAADAIPVNRPT